jgi:RNA polymerase sigma-70 factor (ECF subfamily)
MNSADQDRFVVLLVRHQDEVYRFIQYLLPRHADADDVYQQTCLVLWQKRGQFDPDREFLPWARGVARNEIRRFCRQHAHERVTLSDAIMDKLAATSEAQHRDAARVRRALARCLQKLREANREILARCYSGIESIKEVAESLNIAPAALYMKLHRQRRLLGECIRKELNAEDER